MLDDEPFVNLTDDPTSDVVPIQAQSFCSSEALREAVQMNISEQLLISVVCGDCSKLGMNDKLVT